MANTNRHIFETSPLAFGVSISDTEDRLDCAWFNPVAKSKIENLRKNRNRNWDLIKLSKIADVSGGKRLPKGTILVDSEANVIPYIRASDVKGLRVDLDSAVKIPKAVHRMIQDYQLKQNDILITIVGTIGEVGILEEPAEVCDFTENVARVSIEETGVSPYYLLYFLDSELAHLQSERFSVGSLQYKLSLRSCRNLEVYLPIRNKKYDIKLQKVILSKVSSLLKKSEEKRDLFIRLVKEANKVVEEKIGLTVVKSPNSMQVFVKAMEFDSISRLDALFNNPHREELLKTLRKYPHRALGQLAKIQTRTKILPSDFYKLIELEDIDELTGQIKSFREVPFLGSQKYLFEEGDLLVSKLQPDKGKVVTVGKDYAGCVGSSELVPLVINSDEVTLDYLWAVLRSNYILRQWEYELSGSSRMRIGRSEIINTIVPVPDKDIQNKIVKEVKDKMSRAQKALEESKKLSELAKERFLKLLLNRKVD